MPMTAAEAPGTVVTHGMSRLTAALRISYPSLRAPLPCGVLMTSANSPALMRVTASRPPPGPS